MDKLDSGRKIRVLLITGTPFRTDTNVGKTLMTLFSGFGRTELCQLYFSPEVPNTDMCGSYYQICEKQMIGSLFGIRKKRCGGIIEPAMGKSSEKPEINSPLLTRNKGKIHRRLAREAVWGLTHWKNRKFSTWLKEEDPDVIFTIMHDTNGAVKTVRYIAKKTGCPVVLFITDDYYHDSEESRNVFRKWYYGRRQRLNQMLSEYVKCLVGCSEIAAEYFTNILKIHGGGGQKQSIRLPHQRIWQCL